MKKEQLKRELLKKELVKPASTEDRLVKEVETLCGELRNCPRLRRQSGTDTGQEDDILF